MRKSYGYPWKELERGSGAFGPHRYENDIEVLSLKQGAHEGKRKFFMRIDRLCQK